MEIKLNEKKKNNALEYLPKMKSNYDLVSPFYNDIKYTLYNGCKYYPNMLCAQHDFTIFNKIKEDLFKEEVFSTLNYLKLRKIKRLIDENQLELEKAIGNDEQMICLQTHQHLKQVEMELTKQLGTVIFR